MLSLLRSSLPRLAQPFMSTPMLFRGFASPNKHKRVLKAAKGFKGSGSRTFKAAKSRLEKAYSHAYVGRKLKKRRFKKLWISSISASLRIYGLSYSKFTNAWRGSDVRVNRKVLAELGEKEPFSFKAVVDVIMGGAKS